MLVPFYDPKKHTENAAMELLRQEAAPLQAVRDPRPGAYLLSYLGPNPLYADVRGADKYIYAGSSTGNHGARTGKHFRSLQAVYEFDPEDLNPEDFLVRCLAMPQENVRAVEKFLIDMFRIRWNQPEFLGFGNNNSPRVGSRASNWDIIHPGRDWAMDLNRPPEALAVLQRKRAARAAQDRDEHPVFDLLGWSAP